MSESNVQFHDLVDYLLDEAKQERKGQNKSKHSKSASQNEEVTMALHPMNATNRQGTVVVVGDVDVAAHEAAAIKAKVLKSPRIQMGEWSVSDTYSLRV